MKPGLALPLEVWADVSEHPLLTRQLLARIADNNGDPVFTNKLQKLLHGCGHPSLRFLKASSKINSWKYQLRKSKKSKFSYENGKYRKFYLDDQVLDFLAKIKPLLTNVTLKIVFVDYPKNLRILLGHLLPMVGSIRQINCSNYYMQMLERRVPGTLACVKELDLGLLKHQDIPTYLDWLSAPLDFDLNGPRFLKIDAYSDTIIALVDAVRNSFLAANAPSTFVILIDYSQRAEEFNLDNAVTKEKLTIRNAQFKRQKYGMVIHYVEIMRHPTGTDAKMRDWIEKRAYYEKLYKEDSVDHEEKQVISISSWPPLTIGQITKQADGMDQSEDKHDGNAAGPSTSSAKTKKTCVIL